MDAKILFVCGLYMGIHPERCKKILLIYFLLDVQSLAVLMKVFPSALEYHFFFLLVKPEKALSSQLSLANLLSVHSVSLSMTPSNMLNSACPNTSPEECHWSPSQRKPIYLFLFQRLLKIHLI